MFINSQEGQHTSALRRFAQERLLANDRGSWEDVVPRRKLQNKFHNRTKSYLNTSQAAVSIDYFCDGQRKALLREDFSHIREESKTGGLLIYTLQNSIRLATTLGLFVALNAKGGDTVADLKSQAAANFSRSNNHPMDRGESVYSYPQIETIYTQYPKLRSSAPFQYEWRNFIAHFEATLVKPNTSFSTEKRQSLARMKISFYIRWGIAKGMFQVGDPAAHQRFWNRLWQYSDTQPADAGAIFNIPASVLSANEYQPFSKKDWIARLLLGPTARAQSTNGGSAQNPDTGIVKCSLGQIFPLPKCHYQDAEAAFYYSRSCEVDTDGTPDPVSQKYSEERQQHWFYKPNLADVVDIQRKPGRNETPAQKKKLDEAFEKRWGTPSVRFKNPEEFCQYDRSLGKKVRKPSLRINLIQRRDYVSCHTPDVMPQPEYAGETLEIARTLYSEITQKPVESKIYLKRNECKSLSPQELEGQEKLIYQCKSESAKNCSDIFDTRTDLSDYDGLPLGGN